MMNDNCSTTINVYGQSLEAKVIATCLSNSNFKVKVRKGVDYDLDAHETQVAAEPKLTSYYSNALRSGKLRASSDSASKDSIHWVIYKGKDDRSLIEFLLSLLEKKSNPQTIILTTNLAIGLHDFVKSEIESLCEANSLKKHHQIVTIPPFIREGTAIDDFINPPLLLIGVDSDESRLTVKEILLGTIESAREVHFMSGTEVEIVSNAVSAFLAMRVSFINELSKLLEAKEVDIVPIVDAMSCDPRFGDSYNEAGCGFGGVALQQAVLNIQSLFRDSEAGSLMMQATLDINEEQKEILFRKFWNFYGSQVAGKRVGVWGATFRARTASVINSPVIKLINALTSESVEVSLYDPMLKPGNFNLDLLDDSINISSSKYEVLKDKDALFVVTDWDEFKCADLTMIKKLLSQPVIFDGRNIFEIEKVNKVGLDYFGIGRNNIKG